MNFSTFQDSLYKSLEERVMEDGKGDITFRPVIKNNETLSGMIYTPNGTSVGTTFYAESFYEQYKSGSSIEELANQIYDMFQKYAKEIHTNVREVTEYLKDVSRIFPALISREGNEGFLKDMAYVPFENLAIIFKYNIPELEGTVNMTKDQLKTLDMDVSEVLEIAKNNPIFKDSIEVIPLLEMAKRASPELAKQTEGMQGPSMYVVTNKELRWGAAAILDMDFMAYISEELEDDLYIIPSSVDECIVVPKSELPLYQLEEMVKEVNAAEVPPQLRLADNIYQYDSDTKSIRIAVEERQMNIVQNTKGRQH